MAMRQLRALQLALACVAAVSSTDGAGSAQLGRRPPPPPPRLALDAILGSGMVLPADNAQLWGTGAAPTAKISVTVAPASGASKTFSAAAEPGGSWAVNVSMPAGLTLYTVTVASSAAGSAGSTQAEGVVMADVMFGALVICAGQRWRRACQALPPCLPASVAPQTCGRVRHGHDSHHRARLSAAPATWR